MEDIKLLFKETLEENNIKYSENKNYIVFGVKRGRYKIFFNDKIDINLVIKSKYTDTKFRSFTSKGYENISSLLSDLKNSVYGIELSKNYIYDKLTYDTYNRYNASKHLLTLIESLNNKINLN